MKRATTILAAGLLGLLGTALAQAEVPEVMTSVAAKAAGALANVEFEVENELGRSKVAGTGICIHANGTLLTTALDVFTPPGMIKSIRIVLPGKERKTLEAKLLGIDRQTGVTFVQATGEHKWSVVRFARRTNLAVGQTVVSVGLMGPNLGYQSYLGVAHVSAVLRAPGDLVYVTGGELGGVGSPVFTPDGLAVGIVRRQLYQSYQMLVNRQVASVRLSGMERTVFFVPVEEFVQSLENIPSDRKVRRRSWIGVTRILPLPENMAKIAKITVPAVVLGKVVDGTPASKAGLRDGDYVIAMNGEGLEKFASPQTVAQNFTDQIERMKAGTKISLTVAGSMGRRTINDVEVQPWPMRPQEAAQYFDRILGLVMREKILLDEYADEAPAKEDGLIVLMVARDGPAAQGELRRGDLVVGINGTNVKTVPEVRKLITDALTRSPEKKIILMVKRGGQSEAITIQPPSSR